MNSNLITIAVTGASGFIAQHLINRLLSEGVLVKAISRKKLDRAGIINISVDYDDFFEMSKALSGCDVVIHLAARAHHEDGNKVNSLDIDRLYYQANVEPLNTVVRAAIAESVKRVIFVSSIGVNGDIVPGKPFTGLEKPNPVEPYAKSKYLAEELLFNLLHGHDVEYVILRPPLVYGPNCPGNFGRLSNLVKSCPVVPFGALKSPRSFIGVRNLVDALWVCTYNQNVRNQTFLISDSRDLSVSEICKILMSMIGKSCFRVLFVPKCLLSSMAFLFGKKSMWKKLNTPLQIDASNFSVVTGWTPPFSIEDGLEEMLINDHCISKIST